MDHRVPRTGAIISVGLALLALITFLYLNSKFEGPDPTRLATSPFELTARFENTKKLPTKQPVLYKGIAIGRVKKVAWDPAAQLATVTFTLDDGFELHRDALLQIGERSLLGDPYLNLVSRGSDSQPRLEKGDRVRTERSVNFDEALDFLDKEGRKQLRSLIKTIGEGVSPPGNAERLNDTVGGVSLMVRELNALTRELNDQEQELTRLVTGASTVLSTLGQRESDVRTIVGSGRTTLDALASNTASLDQALVELPLLLDSGRRSLAAATPALIEAYPLVAKLRLLAPDLNRALSESRRHSLGDVTRDTVRIVEGLAPLRRTGRPVLRELRRLLLQLDPLVRAASPGARNLVPALSYLTPRVKAIAGLYALMAAQTAGRDSVGHYLRSGFGFVESEETDQPTDADCDPHAEAYCANAYPGPNDALDPKPFVKPYPRLVPCTVPSRRTPKRPCS